MDRNVRRCYHGCYSLRVALRKESVDRNGIVVLLSVLLMVALRKESVDRNSTMTALYRRQVLSLSARRAWIEMLRLCVLPGCIFVALRKESVDRNVIIIFIVLHSFVALRKESVDRNGENSPPKTPPRTSLSARRAWIEIRPAASRQTARKCRSPQGERG